MSSPQQSQYWDISTSKLDFVSYYTWKSFTKEARDKMYNKCHPAFYQDRRNPNSKPRLSFLEDTVKEFFPEALIQTNDQTALADPQTLFSILWMVSALNINLIDTNKANVEKNHQSIKENRAKQSEIISYLGTLRTAINDLKQAVINNGAFTNGINTRLVNLGIGYTSVGAPTFPQPALGNVPVSALPPLQNLIQMEPPDQS